MPAALIPLIQEILRLVNNLLEGTPIEQRRASSIAWFQMTWPLVKGLLPAATQTQIEAIMSEVKA